MVTSNNSSRSGSKSRCNVKKKFKPKGFVLNSSLGVHPNILDSQVLLNHHLESLPKQDLLYSDGQMPPESINIVNRILESKHRKTKSMYS